MKFAYCPILSLLLSLAAMPAVAQTSATETKALGIALENFEYPYPVKYRAFTLHGEDVRMAYMDIPAEGHSTSPNAPVAVLFHGKNFFGAYWENTIRALAAEGYRVVVPDQIGFGKSTKPEIPYSFHDMAANTNDLLKELGIQQVAAVIGHSMGGMLATRYALMYPDTTQRLVLENPIGLEDYRTTVPYARVNDYYQEALKTTLEGTRKYHQTYYTSWKPEYDRWVEAQYGMTLGGEAARLAMVSALTTQMIYEQPVVHQFPEVKVPTLVVIGQEDRTTIGRNKLTPEQLKVMGQYPQLGKKTAEAIPNAELVELHQVGHSPHIEAPEKFHEVLIPFLKK